MTDPRLIRLRELLQKALELELFTIPPYLTALYSIKDRTDGRNKESAKIIQSVVVEEMLHATLVSNLMNAVGATPHVSPELSDDKLTNCRYPSRVPHVNLNLEVGLSSFSKDTVKCFRTIEAPERPEEWRESIQRNEIHSIGHLYHIVLEQLIALANDLGEKAVFLGNPCRQVRPEHYYGGAGRVLPVENLTDARTVICEVAQQGEGRVHVSNLTGDELRFHQPKEVAHYYRFEEILAERYYERDDDLSLSPSGAKLEVDWSAVYDVEPISPSNAARANGLRELLETFEESYAELLRGIHQAFNGAPQATRGATNIMKALEHGSLDLMRIDIGDGKTCGPPFWFVRTKQAS